MIRKAPSFSKKAALFLIRNGLNGLAYVAPGRAGRLALRLFSTPLRGRFREPLPEILDRADERLRIEHRGEEIGAWFYRGTRETVLLAHGWESNAARWKPLLKRLQEAGFSVLLVDAPGHGTATGKHFTAILYAEYLEKVCAEFQPRVLVGHSAGGMAGMYLLTQLQAPSLQKLAVLGMPGELTRLMETYRDVLGMKPHLFRSLDREIERKYGRPTSWFSMPAFAERLEAEGLIVHDPKDLIAPWEDILNVHEAWTGSELIALEGEGHNLRSERVWDAVLEFLD